MGACKVEVDPGACKMKTVIVCKPSDDMMSVVFEVQTDCKFVKRYLENLPKDINPYTTLESPMGESVLYTAANGTLNHSACPIPCAMIKAMEVASDMGIKRDVKFTITDA